MKYIRPINEFFGPFKKSKLFQESEDDRLANDFLNRLLKIDENNPYEIEKTNHNRLADQIAQGYGNIMRMRVRLHSTRIYKVRFDDVYLLSSWSKTRGRINRSKLFVLNFDYSELDEIKCSDSIAYKIYKTIDDIYNRSKDKDRLNRLRQNINPAADIL